MSSPSYVPDTTEPPAFTQAGAVVRSLIPISAVLALMLAAISFTARFLEANPARIPVLTALLRTGAAGLIGATICLALTGIACTLLFAWARSRTMRAAPSPSRRRLPAFLARFAPTVTHRPAVSRVAGWPQAVVMLAGTAGAAALVLRFPPLSPAAADPGLPWPGVAGLMLLPAFILIGFERATAWLPVQRLPERDPLCRLLRLPAAMLILLAGLAAARGFGIGQPLWIARLLAGVVLAVAAELALRSLGTLFLPLPAPDRARAAIGSILLAVLEPSTFRPSEIAERIRAQLGIDIASSWAMQYARAAALPVLAALLLAAWGLSGVVRIKAYERAAYERFGAPVAVLDPGLHLLLPWPFGQARTVEYDVVHAVAATAPAATGRSTPLDTSLAEGAPPATANRLWSDQPDAETTYLIAGRSGARESFEAISADARIVYRVGLDDESALRALYNLNDPDRLVGALSGQLLARFFAQHTLDQVLGERRERIADQLRRGLQAELDARATGLEVVALVVESLHPPGGAAVAYRRVQAAQIIASTKRAEEVGRAHTTLSVAKRDAHDVRDQAQAVAAELTGAAEATRAQEDADLRASRAGGRSFVLERYLASLRTALPHAGLEIIDHRLPASEQPVIDFRGAVSPPNAREAQ